MAEISVLEYVIAVVVLALLLLGFVIIARFTKKQSGHFWGSRLWGASRGLRLRVLEGAQVDGKRRLVLVACDEREYLLLVGGQGDLLLDKKGGGEFSEMLGVSQGGEVDGQRGESSYKAMMDMKA